MIMATRLADIHVIMIAQTNLAWLFRFDVDVEPVWVDKVACDFNTETNVVTMTEAYAIELGMI